MPKQRTVAEVAPQRRSVPIEHRQQQTEQVPNVIYIPLNHSSVSSLSSEPSSSLSKWTIPPHGLPKPPMWLERSTLACRHQNQPQQVLEDIAAFLRPTTVECYYNRQNKIDCRWACSLQFVIYLWLDNNNDDDDDREEGTVLVELQRRQGCSIQFHHIKQQLFLTLQQQQMMTDTNHDTIPSLDLSRNDLLARSWIQKQTDGSKSFDSNSETKSDNDSLMECQKMLRDNFMSGMEQLLFLVVHHPKSAEQFMLGSCQECFRQLMTESLQSPTPTSHKYDMSHRRRLALNILVEVLPQLSKASTNTIRQPPPSRRKPLIEMDDPFWQKIVRYLRDCIHNADSHPQEAALAIQCLRHLYVLTSPLTDMNEDSSSFSLSSLDDLLFQDEAFLKDLQRAHVLGRIHHQPLATEACRLVDYYGETTV